MDVIRINNMHVPCFIGIHRHERHERQTLILDVEMYLDVIDAGNQASMNLSVDYSRIYGELRFLLEACHFRLLETAAQALCAYLLAPPPIDRQQSRIESVCLKLSKPTALKSEAIPSLTVRRDKNAFNLVVESNHFGSVDIIHESNDCGIYRLRIPAGGTIPAHYHELMAEGEMALSDGLLLQGKPLPAGLAHFWPQKFVHRYDNPTSTERTILCVNRPSFIPTDEILVKSDEQLPEIPAALKIRYF